MIDRRAVVMSIVLTRLMFAATLWRLARLPDRADGPNGAPSPVRNPLVLFGFPQSNFNSI
jgi:hypothetical protein